MGLNILFKQYQYANKELHNSMLVIPFRSQTHIQLLLPPTEQNRTCNGACHVKARSYLKLSVGYSSAYELVDRTFSLFIR